jgi:Tfp pilus assembly protein PilE
LLNKKRSGFMTTELMVVAIVLAILSGIAASAVPTFAGRAKRSALASTLSVLQGASDRYFVESNLYASESQPVAGSKVCQINVDAIDALGQKFIGYYLHSEPNARAIDYGLSASDGGELFFGVTQGGRIFGTQTAPTDHAWTTGTAKIFTQESCDGTLTLASIW